ncbi:MAG: ADP-ribosylglycohydrolase family protein [Clostridia bacterium]|nr:ADP-ribosylglycohydrolase family protein [Clostridia bacterium]
MTENRLQVIRDIVYGHAVADALGVPVEFCSRQKLKDQPVCGMRGFGYHKVPAGTWSDDTTMALAAMDSFALGVDYEDMMGRLVAWKREAAYTATNLVFDMGVSTHFAISRYERGVSPLACGGTDEDDNGNGSLMRIYPAVLYWHFAQKKDACGLDEFIFDNSALTHGHLRSKLACGIYARLLLRLLAGGGKADIPAALQEAKRHYGESADIQSELKHFDRLFDPGFARLKEEEIISSGYVVTTLEAALWCLLTTDSYRECALKAVNLGSDTDTVAAVAGSLAGCVYGMESIPEEWLKVLQNRKLLEDVCDAFSKSPFTLPENRG